MELEKQRKKNLKKKRIKKEFRVLRVVGIVIKHLETTQIV